MPGRLKMTKKDTETLTEGESPPPAQQLTVAMEDEERDNWINEILSAIYNLKKDLKEDSASKFDTVIQSMQSIQGKLKQCSGQLTEAEERLGAVEDDASAL